jgi:prepilin-type N-terminal cleavage/methylation domain-containing protein
MVPLTTRSRRENGFTLVELLVVLVLAGVVVAAICQSLQSNQRFYRSQSQLLDVEEGLRAVAQLVPAELRELNARGGDIVAMGRDSITLRAMRSLGVICAPPNVSAGTIVIADSLSFGWRAVDPSRDRALVFRDGDETSADDDRWLDFGVAGVRSGVACGDGSAGTTLRLTGPTSDLDGVSAGSPLRTYERVTYRLYTDDQGLSWLGERGYSDGAWSALSPVAGPLRRAGGLSFDYYDSAGAPAAAAPGVVRIGVAARGLSAGPIAVPGRTTSGRQYEDSVVVQVALRNN